MAALTRAKVDLLTCDRELNEKINLCSVVTFVFSLASLGWLAAGIYNPQCLDGWMVFVSVWLNFLPLPLSIIYLAMQSATLFREVEKNLDALMKELM